MFLFKTSFSGFKSFLSQNASSLLTTELTIKLARRSFQTSPITLAKKKRRVFVKLESSAGTGFSYLRKKSQSNLQKKSVFRKFDPIVNRYVIFTEKKFKRK